MNSKKEDVKRNDRGDGVLASTLKGVGLRSAPAVRLMRKLLEAGRIQPVLEAVAEVLLSESILSGRVPTNAGRPTQDFALAAEAAISDVVNEYHMQGNPLTSRYVPPLGLVAEMCKQWIVGFAAPIPETSYIRGTLGDPEIQDRLTVVALKLRELFMSKTEVRPQYDDAPGWFMHAEKLEALCRDASVAMFLAFQHPNDTNHQLIHGDDDELG